MIGQDTSMVLVFQNADHSVKEIFSLGYFIFDGNEMAEISQLAEAKGLYAYVREVEEISHQYAMKWLRDIKS